jgi:hypothetical protein
MAAGHSSLPLSMSFRRSLRRFSLPLAAALLAGCATTKAPRVYQEEAFNSETPYAYWSTLEPNAACEVAKRALLSQGYQVDDSKPTRIRGEKLFQPKPETGVKLDISLTCLPSNVGAVLYANALLTHYELKAQGTSAGVAVNGFGSISLPWATDKDSLVKVGEETVADSDFYKRLFALIQSLEG